MIFEVLHYTVHFVPIRHKQNLNKEQVKRDFKIQNHSYSTPPFISIKSSDRNMHIVDESFKK